MVCMMALMGGVAYAGDNQEKEKDRAQITSVATDLNSGEIHINGLNLPQEELTSVTLGGVELVIISSGENWLDAYLPAGTTAGDYHLVINGKHNKSVAYDLTIGAVGPQGPAGSQGATGPMGPQGPTGKRGPMGPQGSDRQDRPDGTAGPDR